MEFRILGPLEVSEHGHAIPLGSAQQRSLLAVLLLNANKTVSTDRLIDELWGENPPATAAKIIQNYVSRLRSTLQQALKGEPDEIIVTRGSGYELRVRASATDVERFEELLASGRRAIAVGKAKEASRTLRDALAIWRGSALEDFAFERFAQTEIARLEERRLVALEERIEAELMLGHHRDLVGEIEALVAEHPFRERLRGQLMLALYRSGRQSEALHAYQQARAALVGELGLEPGPALQRLEKAILEQDRSLDLTDAPTGPATFARPARTASGRRLVALGTILLLAAVGGGLIVVFARSSGGGLNSIAGNSVGVIDPARDELVAQVPVGRTPTSVAVGGGAVWALNSDDQTISRIDVRTLEVEEFGTGTRPTDLAVGPEAVWVANGVRASPLTGHPVATSVSRIDPSFGHVRQTIRLPRPHAALSNLIEDHLAVGSRAVWAVNPDFSVSRIDTDTGAVVHVRGLEAAAIAADERSVWALNVDNTLARLNPSSGRIEKLIKIPATTLSDIALGDGSVWVAAPFDGVVWRVDPGARDVLRTIDTGFGTNRVAFGRESLWTANSLRGTVTRIDAESNRVVATIALGNTPRSLAVGEGRVWVTVSGAADEDVLAAAPASDVAGVRALPRSICGGVFYGGPGNADYLIVSDLPLQGGDAFPTLQMSEAIAFTLRRRGFRAGKYRVAYQSCDDSTTATGIYDPRKCVSNAKAYARNRDVIGVVGPFNSSCAEAAIPVANAALDGPLPLISPSNSVVDLTKRGPRAPRDQLERLYPTGKRNYVRIFPTEDSQSAAHAVLAKRLGLRRVYVLHDGDEQFGLPKAIFFRKAARRLDLQIAGFRAWDPLSADYAALAGAVARARPDAVFLGGGLYSNGGRLIRELRREFGRRIEILAPEFLPISQLFEDAGSGARGTYVSRPGLTSDRLPRTGRRFLRDFAPIQPGGRVEIQAAYAAQATEVLLDAIARSDGSRASVTRELFSIRVRNGILGNFVFDANGDSSHQSITILRAITPGGAKKIEGVEGAVVDRVITPPPELTK